MRIEKLMQNILVVAGLISGGVMFATTVMSVNDMMHTSNTHYVVDNNE